MDIDEFVDTENILFGTNLLGAYLGTEILFYFSISLLTSKVLLGLRDAFVIDSCISLDKSILSVSYDGLVSLSVMGSCSFLVKG